MRTEEQVREKLQRLLDERDLLSKQAARAVLSEDWDEQEKARGLLDRVRHAEITIRALDWALGNK